MQYVCEVCGKTEELTETEAFNKGWDYPPFMGKWGVLSPRTCPNCPIIKTTWWKVQMNAPLDEHDLETLDRIAGER